MIPISFSKTKEITHYIGLQIDLVLQPQAIIKRLNNGTYSVNYHYEEKILGIALLTDYSKEVDQGFDSNNQSNLEIPSLLDEFDEISSDFIFVLSLRGLFLHVSEKHANLIGYTPKEMIGRTVGEFIHPSDLVALMRDLRDCSTKGRANSICRVRRKTLGYLYMELNAHVYEGSKRNRCFIVSGREIYIPIMELLKIYTPEQTENEIWIKLSIDGLFLFATKSCQLFFGIPQDLISSYSIYDFIISDHLQFKNYLNNTEIIDCEITLLMGQVCSCRVYKIVDELRVYSWVQIKKNHRGLKMLQNGDHVFSCLEGMSSNSIFYETNKLKMQNTRLAEEIEKLVNCDINLICHQ
jgi:PAS domain S-box-containing protein